METCFVIQPFDNDKFDQRYTDIFEPAIRAAGLEPYRVDRDPSVRIPIEQIEEGIKSAKICFAEITLDNPNVWYELGFAFASGKDVVLVTEERQKFPFDIQHRQVINYKTTSKSDYEKLEINIKDKLVALLGRQKSVKQIIDNPVKESEGLKQHEVTMMLMIIENQLTSEDTVSVYSLKSDMDKAGFNAIAISLSIRELQRKGFIETFKEYSDFNNQEYLACKLTQSGEAWIMNNQDKIEFRKKKNNGTEIADDLPY
ncbi:MAG: hypothetical protein KA734_06830 [Fluviicola sp.]|nr:hypothetical protein [Fluviicola sp.]